MAKATIISILVLSVAYLQLAQAYLLIAAPIIEDSYKEQQCIPAPSSSEIGLDLKWFGSQKKFYLPFWSKLYKLRTAKDNLDREPLYDYELWPNSACLVFEGNMVNAFGQSVKYNISGDASSISFRAPRKHSKFGKFEFHLTDNKTFILGVTCWEDDQSSWALLTTQPFLDIESRERILKYVQEKGFKLENVVDENYATCSPLLRSVYHQPYVLLYPAHRYQPLYYSYWKSSFIV